MTAELFKGLPIAQTIRDELKDKVADLKLKGINPKLAVILVGDDEASKIYAQSKEKVAQKIGIKVELHIKPANTSENELLSLIDSLNNDRSIHGILVELPLPRHIRKEQVMNKISPVKDVDGVHPINKGYLLGGQENLALLPATPLACIALLERNGVNLAGKNVTLIGRGDTVGRPLASLLIKRDATVSICHTKTVNLSQFTKNADILIVATGRPNLVGASLLTKDQIIIDAGINQLADGSITGDVDTQAAMEIVKAINPVPGGVGALTTTIIMENLMKAIVLQHLA